jgi:hypothetical protein
VKKSNTIPQKPAAKMTVLEDWYEGNDILKKGYRI